MITVDIQSTDTVAITIIEDIHRLVEEEVAVEGTEGIITIMEEAVVDTVSNSNTIKAEWEEVVEDNADIITIIIDAMAEGTGTAIRRSTIGRVDTDSLDEMIRWKTGSITTTRTGCRR